MKPNLNKVLILESGGSHDEILYSQFRFLKDSGFETHLIIREEHLERARTPREADFVISLARERGWRDRWKNLLTIRKYLRVKNINYLVINTCQGAFIRDLSLLLPRGINITGISHNPQKLNRSFNQKIINRKVKKYLVLSENILNNVQTMNPGLSLKAFYPVFYPPVSSGQNEKSFLIAVPGAVDLNRRDYYHLLDELKIKALNKSIKFLFLGRCKSEEARKFRSEFSSVIHSSHYQFFDEFIPEKEFLEMVAKSDLILPLITPELDNYELYRDYKITGGINLAIGFRVPLLLTKSLRNNQDYETSSFFYEKTRLVEMINHLSENKTEIKQKKSQIEKTLKFNYNYQKDNYTSFVFKSI